MTPRRLIAAAALVLLAAGAAAQEAAPAPEPDRPEAEADAADAKDEAKDPKAARPDADAGEKAEAGEDADAKEEGKPLTVTVKGLSGTAHRLTPGKEGKWVPLKVGETLDERTIIRTGFRTKVVLAFADNSTVTVSRATKMGVAEFRKEGKITRTRLGLKYGAVRADVEEAKGPNDFTVTAPVATLAVTGSGGGLAFNGDSGFKTNCSHGGFNVNMGFKGLSLVGGEGTNNALIKAILIKQILSTPRLAVLFGGTTPNEKQAMLNRYLGRGGIGFLGGGVGARRVLRPRQQITRSDVDTPGLDIDLGD